MRCITFFIAYGFLALLPLQAQNIGINATGATPNASAMLDISANDRGLLIPRMTAAQRAAITSPATGLLVFQTNASAPVPANQFWYYDGSDWLPLLNHRTGWSTLGNVGTVASTNFLGTTDDIALRLRTNNFERFEVSTGTGGATGTGGQLLAFQNGTATAPTYSWSTNPGMGLFRAANNVMGVATGGVERLRFPNTGQVHAMADGTASAPFFSWQADTRLGMYRITTNTLGLATNGIERMRIAPSGYVGIGGTPANGAILDVQSTNRGVLLPRVALISLASTSPVGAGNVVDGLLVYNTSTAGSGQNQVTPGLYQWDGPNGRWRRFVNMVHEVWLTTPTTINANTEYTITTTIPGVQWSSGVSVALAGNWPTAPDVTIKHIEARTNQVRFIIVNNTGGLFGGGINYLDMDFNITVTRW